MLRIALLLLCASLGLLRAWSEPPHDRCASTLALSADGRLHVFALSKDSTLWHKQRQDAADGWSSWLLLGPGGCDRAASTD